MLAYERSPRNDFFMNRNCRNTLSKITKKKIVSFK